MGMNFGDPENPLLVSCRSGARSSMPGMMETVLNVGLATSTIPGLIKRTNERFVYDAYRRLIMMYSDVVMEKAEGIEPEDGKGIRKLLDDQLEACKKENGYTSDSDLTVADLKKLCADFKKTVKKVLKREFPDDPVEQLWGGIGAVFKSWNGKKATAYRRIENIPDDWGTAVNVQSMVFGNMNDNSATGVAFTRDPATGDNKFYGEWLVNAQGEDVVAGTRTPNPLNNETKNEQNKQLKSMEELLPKTYRELVSIRKKLEKHYKDMLDIEFTIQDGTLYMLQCRVGKRTGTAALNMALDMVDEKLISKETAVMRVTPVQLDELLHPILDAKAEKKAAIIAKGLPAADILVAARVSLYLGRGPAKPQLLRATVTLPGHLQLRASSRADFDKEQYTADLTLEQLSPDVLRWAGYILEQEDPYILEMLRKLKYHNLTAATQLRIDGRSHDLTVMPAEIKLLYGKDQILHFKLDSPISGNFMSGKYKTATAELKIINIPTTIANIFIPDKMRFIFHNSPVNGSASFQLKDLCREISFHTEFFIDDLIAQKRRIKFRYGSCSVQGDGAFKDYFRTFSYENGIGKAYTESQPDLIVTSHGCMELFHPYKADFYLNTELATAKHLRKMFDFVLFKEFDAVGPYSIHCINNYSKIRLKMHQTIRKAVPVYPEDQEARRKERLSPHHIVATITARRFAGFGYILQQQQRNEPYDKCRGGRQ